jgi:predicted nucleotidyltransferase
VTNRNDLYEAAVKALQDFRANYPGIKAVISGGFLRDYALGRHPKDCDVFIEMPAWLDEPATAMASRLRWFFGDVAWAHEIPEEYRTVPGIALIGTAGLVGDDIFAVVPFNIIVLHPGCDPVEDAKQNDFGICQVWDEGTGPQFTNAYLTDLENSTFTLDVCENKVQFDRSMRRAARLLDRFGPPWKLVIPARFDHLKSDL